MLIPFPAVVCNTCYIPAGQLQAVLILILRTIMMGYNDVVIGCLIINMCIGMDEIEVCRLREVKNHTFHVCSRNSVWSLLFLFFLPLFLPFFFLGFYWLLLIILLGILGF